MDLAYDLYLPSGDREENLPPVILLHGMMDSRKTWKFIAPEIARHTGRKVYAVDARNHGESPWNNEISFDILADDLDNFLTQHKIPKATLIGHSMGGRTALTLALKKPEKVEKLVVEDMILRNFRPSHSSFILQLRILFREALSVIPAGADDTLAKESIIKFITNVLPKSRIIEIVKSSEFDLSMVPLKRDTGGFSWQTNLDALEQFLTTDKIQQKLSGVYVGDALFLYGTKSVFKVDKDPLIPQFFPRAIKVGFENSSHLVHFEFPERFVKEVSLFINGFRNVQSKY